MTDLTAELVFTRAIALNEPPNYDRLQQRNLFRSSPNTGMLRRIGATPEDSLVPRYLRPTNVVEQEVLRWLKRWGVSASGNRAPYSLSLLDQPVSLTLSVRVFPPKVLAMSVRLGGLSVCEEGLVEQLVDLQLDVTKRIAPAIQSALATMVATGDHRAAMPSNLRLQGRTMPAIHLQVPVGRSAVPDWADAHAPALVATVIRDPDYRSTDPELFDELLGRNRELNRKGGQRRLLDKQGALFVSSLEEPDQSATEFSRLVDFETMALVLRQFFAVYPSARFEAPHLYDFLLAKGALWVSDPERVLRDSVTSQHAWRLLVEQIGLDRDLDRLMTQNGVEARLLRVRDGGAALDHEWWLAADLDTALSDLLGSESPEPSPSPMPSIQIMNAAAVQIAAGDINNYRSFDELADAIAEAIDQLTDVDDDAREEARGLLARIRGKGDAVATSAAGSAGGAILGAVLKQLLGLP